MKNYLYLFFICLILFLSACSGSDVYQGKWKATDINGKKFEIDFGPKNFSITNSNGKTDKYEYTQRSVRIMNSVATYSIMLNDKRTYHIHFPIANETSKGVIMINDYDPLYAISRTSYIHYRDLYKLAE